MTTCDMLFDVVLSFVVEAYRLDRYDNSTLFVTVSVASGCISLLSGKKNPRIASISIISNAGIFKEVTNALMLNE